MLKKLSIKNFAVIEDISIEFKEGMNILIGETGAGKSIIIDALSLLKGEKSMFDKIRLGQEKAYISGEFEITSKSLLNELRNEYDDLIEDSTLVVSRSLDVSNKSNAKVNYHSVPISILKRIMDRVIDIHSQHKNNVFFDETKQLGLIDDYIKTYKDEEFNRIYSSYKQDYINLVEERKKLLEIKKIKDSIDDIDYLTYQYEELTKANIQENEIEEVENELKTLESFEEFSSIMTQFDDAYNNASNSLYLAKKFLEKIKNEQFKQDIERFNSSYYEIEDAHEAIISRFKACAENLDRIDYLKARKSLFSSLKRKYGSSTKEILARYNEIKEQIDVLNDYEYNLERQNKIIEEKEKNAYKKAQELSSFRKNELSDLENKINIELHDLLLENAEFKIHIDECELNEDGIDKIAFMIKANVGGKFLNLKDSASLGETSRINLALKNVFNSLNPVETIIFDEIDTGISGRVAIATSKKIHSISKEGQSIVISHLPQVAAGGDHHFFVKKNVVNDETKTTIFELSNEEAIHEIAKIISNNSNVDSIRVVKELIKEVRN